MEREPRDTLDNTKAQMRKGILEFCIMLIIDRGGSLYASDILKQLQAIDMIVVEGTVYPLLNRLRREGIVPGVVYGGGDGDSTSFKVDSRTLRQVLAEVPAGVAW